jgi:hypothetical protein
MTFPADRATPIAAGDGFSVLNVLPIYRCERGSS